MPSIYVCLFFFFFIVVNNASISVFILRAEGKKWWSFKYFYETFNLKFKIQIKMYIPKNYLSLFIPEALKYQYLSHNVKYYTSIVQDSRPILGISFFGCRQFSSLGQRWIFVVFGGRVINGQHSYGYQLCSSSFIHMRQTWYRGFSRKTKRNLSPILWFHNPIYRWCPFIQ